MQENSIESSSYISGPEQETNTSQKIIKKTIHNIVIFDWDDTLFCTNYFHRLNFNLNEVFSGKKSINELGFSFANELIELEHVKVKLKYRWLFLYFPS
jgi:hypothetical protein